MLVCLRTVRRVDDLGGTDWQFCLWRLPSPFQFYCRSPFSKRCGNGLTKRFLQQRRGVTSLPLSSFLRHSQLVNGWFVLTKGRKSEQQPAWRLNTPSF